MAPSTIVLITGANSGVGLAASKVIASSSAKYHVLVTARTIEKADNAVKEIQTAGGLKGTISALQLDVTDPASLERAVAAVDKQFGRLDVLINNGAIGFSPGREDDLVRNMREVLETNVVGPFAAAQAFRGLMGRSGDARSIFVSSAMSKVNAVVRFADIVRQFGERMAPYAMSKAALNMLATNEMLFYGDKMKVFTFCPGYVVSNLRGTDEESRTGGGKAGSPEVAGHTLLSIIEGRRDEDEKKGVIHKDGVYPY